LPISLSRGVKLSVYELLSVFPPGVYRTLATLWLNVRRRLRRRARRHPKTE
jgi:hypothetical protein